MIGMACRSSASPIGLHAENGALVGALGCRPHPKLHRSSGARPQDWLDEFRDHLNVRRMRRIHVVILDGGKVHLYVAGR